MELRLRTLHSCCRLLAWPRINPIRRLLGVACMAYALLHLGLYVVQQHFDLLVVAREIALRIYLTIGFVALLVLVVLGVTSSDGWLRRLGRRWRRLHRLIYVAIALGVLHFFMQSKLDVSQAALMAGLFVWLILWRAIPQDRQRSLPLLALLSVVAAVIDAGLEAFWYGVATRVDPWRVLSTDVTTAYGLRPAHWVLIIGLGFTALVAVRQASRRIGGQPARGVS